MEFNKRSILWIVFSISLVVLWNDWMVYQGHDSLFSPGKPAATAAAPANASANAALPAAPGAVPAVPGAAPAGAAPAVQAEKITVTTDLVKAEIDTAGGVITRLELLNYKQRQKDDNAPKLNEVLFENTVAKQYLAQTGLVGQSAAGELPNHKTIFTAKPGPRSLEGGNVVDVVLEAEQGGVKLVKTLSFKKGEYVVGVRHDVINTGAAPVAPSVYLQLLKDGNPPAESAWYNPTYISPTLWTPEVKYEKLTFEDIEKRSARNLAPEHATKANEGWVGIAQHFFVAAFIPQDKLTRDIFTKKIDNNLYAIGTVQPMGTVAPGATATNVSRLYVGPQDEKKLETISPGLELVKDYGVLTIIAKPLFSFMTFLQKYIGNWGWTIIALTILIKLAFFPLSAAGFKSMAKIKVLTPKIQALRERYKDDPMTLNQKTMELYRTEKINPLGGCLPILVQMPVFIALYWVLNASVEMRGAPWLGWIQDLTVPDKFGILPIIYIVSMYITNRLNPQPADPVQAKMMLIMPLAFGVLFFFFPAGLVLYWVVNNILSIGQQWVITKKFEQK
jgi:YidC/Oxa1 family membrane protein insertase